MARIAIIASFVLALAACRSEPEPDVEQAVRLYLDRMVQAYRTSNAELVDPLVTEQQGLKLLGLIGVKRDAGVALDAKLLELQFTRVAREGDRWVAETRERWYYADRKLGTGEQVGQDSTDAYAVRYRFVRDGGKLILDELEFIGEPVVGRKAAPMPVDPRILHGLPAAGEAGAAPPVPGHAAGERPPGAPPPGHPPVPGAAGGKP